MKKIYFLFLILFAQTAFTQDIEVNANVIYNQFFDNEDNQDFSSTYTSEIGFALKLAFQGTSSKNFKYRMELGLDRYEGEFNALNENSSARLNVVGSVSKTVISLCLDPIVLKYKDNLEFNLGMELNRKRKKNTCRI